MRALALVVAIVVFAACSTTPKRAPVVVTPVAVARPVHPKPTRPVTPVAPTTGVAMIDPGNYEQEKARIKSVLSKNYSDSLASSEVGYYMDVLQGRLKQISGKRIGISRLGDRIVLDLSGLPGFESGSAQITPEIRVALAPISRMLVEYSKVLVSIRARADDPGAKAINPRLGEQRALALAHVLAEAGVTEKRIVIAGTENHARIELQLEPIVRTAGNEH